MQARLSNRKKAIIDFLDVHDPLGIATLNELRVRSMWRDGKVVDPRTHADQKKSFNRTVFVHGAPLESIDLLKSCSELLTAGIFARWTVWELVERGYLSTIPQGFGFELIMGRDACTGIVRPTTCSFAVVGTSCILRNLWLVANELTDDRIATMSSVPWTIHGIGQFGNTEVIDGSKPIWELNRLPAIRRLDNGHLMSMARIAFRY